MSAITAKASRKMKKYAVLTREPRCFLGSFDFSWEQRKFDEVFDCTVPNNTLSRAELSYDEGTVLNVHYGDVLIKYGSVLDVQKDDIPRIPHRCREDFNGALLQDGDVIIADTAEDETTGKACEIGNLQGSAIVSGLHTMVCRPRNRMALGYLGYYLNSNAYHYQLLPLMQGIKVLSLSRSNIQKTSVSYPIAVKEQQLIAYYFSQLDNLITLHQRKCVFLFGFFQAFISMIFTASTFSWEQRKLEDYLTVSAEKNTGNIYDRSDVLSVSGDYGIVNQIEFQGRSFAGASVSNYGVVQTGDVVYTKSPLNSNPYGIIKTNKGKPGIVSTLYAVYHPKGNAFSDFIQVYFEQHARMNNYMHPLVNKGAKNDMKVSAENALKGPVCFPSRIEQESISAFFSVLDHLITLHQRECISFTARAGRLILTANKKRNTSSWEQRKLGELVDVCSGRDYKHLSEGTIPVYGTGGYMLSVNDALSYDRDAIGIGRKGTIDRPYILKAPFWTVDTLFYAIPREKVDLNFAFDIFQNIDWKKKDESTGVPSLSKTAINNIDVLAPKHGEQQTIGQFFAAIDHLITLHQRKPFLMKWRTSNANRNQTNRLVL